MTDLLNYQSDGPLWTIAALVRATSGKLIGSETGGGKVSGISIDTRSLTPGDLYVAIRGDNLDGHDYVGAAFAAGASGALVAADWDGANDVSANAGPLIVVPETLEAMRAIGRAARATV